MNREVTVRVRKPHPRQEAFIRCKAKRIVVRAGRRGGKTIGMAIKAVESFLAGNRVLYAAPTEDQISSFWFEVKRELAEPVAAGMFTKNETIHAIELPGTKQRIRAKTAFNADTLRGDYCDLLILDEFQLMDEDAWETVGAPMMLDTNGDAVFIYTPPSYRTAGVSKAKDRKYASKMFKRAQADKTGRWAAFHFTSHDNPYLSSVALDELAQDMTALSYRQEVLAEDIDELPGALWTRQTLDKNRVNDAPLMTRIVVGVDPKASAEADSETGIVVVGQGRDGAFYVLDDASIDSTPERWARAVVAAYERNEADRITAEVNQGGDMVTAVLRAVPEGAHLPITPVRATRGKYTRAEPVAALYEQGLVRHVGTFGKLEDQLCNWLPGDASPDRLDALVWAVTALRGTTARPRVREY